LQGHSRSKRDLLRKRRSKGAGECFLCKRKRSTADFAPTRRRRWDSSLRSRPAWPPACAASWRRFPAASAAYGGKDTQFAIVALLRCRLHPSLLTGLSPRSSPHCGRSASPFESLPLFLPNEKAPIKGAFSFGGDGGILRFAHGLLGLRPAQPRGGATRGGKRLHRSLF